MKWSDLKERKYTGIPAGSFQAKFETIYGMILDGKKTHTLNVNFHRFDYIAPYMKAHFHDSACNIPFYCGSSARELSEKYYSLKDAIFGCDNHCEVTATYGKLIMYKNFLTGEEWFKE